MTKDMPLPPRTLRLAGLACRRGELLLFEGLDLTLPPGRLAQLRGPNGAGKTSLLLCLAGIIALAAGTMTVEGRDPEARPGADLGFLPHQTAIKPRLTVTENLSFWAAVNGNGLASLLPALETVGLAPVAGIDAGHLSAGQTRRLALARLIMADRPIWLLDEPTAALDATGEALVGALIDSHLDRGGIVVASTHHDLALADADRITTIVLGAVP